MGEIPETMDAVTDRLRWQCRRSMLELDLAFERFLDSGYPGLSEQQQDLFRQLLAYPDPTLLDWITGKSVPDRESLSELVTLIREADPLKSRPAAEAD